MPKSAIQPPKFCNIHQLIRRIWILYSVGMFIGLGRIWIRTQMNRKMGREEIVMAISMLFWTGNVVLSVFLARSGTNQLTEPERMEITAEEIHRRTIGSKMMLSNWFCYTSFLWGAKLCLLLFYKRLMQGVKQRHYIIFAATTLGCTYLCAILSLFLVCRPFYRNWQVIPDPGSQCTDGFLLVYIIGVFNIVTDGMIMMIPLPVIIKMRIDLIKKVILVLVFSSGSFVMAASTAKIYFTIGRDMRNLTHWSMIETFSAMVVVNAPSIIAVCHRRYRQSRDSCHHNQEHPPISPSPNNTFPDNSDNSQAVLRAIHSSSFASSENDPRVEYGERVFRTDSAERIIDFNAGEAGDGRGRFAVKSDFAWAVTVSRPVEVHIEEPNTHSGLCAPGVPRDAAGNDVSTGQQVPS